jgi:hypothetical protein
MKGCQMRREDDVAPFPLRHNDEQAAGTVAET